MQQKNILLIARSAPYGSANSRELLDIALAGGAFEQNISLLFLGDGVFQLQGQQNSQLLGQKNLSKTLKMLPMYDIEKIYYQDSALELRQLNQPDQAKPISNAAIQQLISQQDVVITL